MTSGTDAPPLPRRRILVVDDSLSVQETVHEAFAGMPHVEVHACGDVEAAELILNVETPDLVLCDVVLPGRPGYDLCRQITRDRQDSRPLVFLLSGAFEPFDQEKADSAGADDVISKPFRAEEIRDRLAGLLAPGAVVEPPAAAAPPAADGEITAADLLPDLPAPGLAATGIPQASVQLPAESSTDELIRRMVPELVERLVRPVAAAVLEQLRESLASQSGEALRREAETQVRRRLQELERESAAGAGGRDTAPEAD